MQDSTELITTLSVDRPFSTARQPVTFGLPFPSNRFSEFQYLALRTTTGELVPCQGEVLSRWTDGSMRWLLLDTVLRGFSTSAAKLDLVHSPDEVAGPKCSAQTDSRALVIDLGSHQFRVDHLAQPGWLSVQASNQTILAAPDFRLVLTDKRGREHLPQFETINLERNGPIRATVCLQGRFPVKPHLRIVVRLCFFSGTGLLRAVLTIHNPHRAKHRHGLWDLGDAGSIFFRDLSLQMALKDVHNSVTTWTEVLDGGKHTAADGQFELYQDSSGGENWQSRNHVNRFGQVPCRFRGYRVRCAEGERMGHRASPIVTIGNDSVQLSAAIPDFWQQFPKAIETSKGCMTLRLFPSQFGDLFELQGGEQKTHTVWLNFGTDAVANEVQGWVHHPADVRATPAWYAESGVFPEFVVDANERKARDRFEDYLQPVLEGPTSLIARHEVIDEFGWRNFGDIYADHENAYYSGPNPVISHYNNQFDSIFGFILQYVRMGDSRWRDLFSPLARHVIDIDIYHTEEDRAAYRGGLFWMTDHYLDAGTSTHRTYSRVNKKPGQSYGGGPGSSHNFTTGLLYYYYLTGDPLAYEAVVSLADWVQRMDDGRLNLLSRIDSGSTGFASLTTDLSYHGPGRGSGLSINSQLDGWLLTGQRSYVEKAEELIRRCIHPKDDIAARDLLNIELRWSYTVFLSVLARYLRLKTEAGELDYMFAYSRAALLHYAHWMLENERPYFDQRQQMEFPTETWAAQEFRKANVLRLASVYADASLRSKLLARGGALADRAWQELTGFPTSHVARAIAILMTEGTRDQYFRLRNELPPAAFPIVAPEFGQPTEFQPQKLRIKELLRSPRGLLRIVKRIVFGKMKPKHC